MINVPRPLIRSGIRKKVLIGALGLGLMAGTHSCKTPAVDCGGARHVINKQKTKAKHHPTSRTSIIKRLKVHKNTKR